MSGRSTAAERWRRDLEAWAIPEALLAAVDESPYQWPVHLWKRRSAAARDDPREPVTTDVVRRHLGERGVLVDIGAGTGRASLPLAAEGHRLVAVERNPDMAAGLREEAADAGAEVEVVEGEWPGIADRVDPADVVMAANVVYDVQDLVPFLSAMVRTARKAVVLELTLAHPWADLAPLYRALHGLDRPSGPTVDDLVEVVREHLEVDPRVERWERSGNLWFESWDEVLDHVGRRLVLPPGRRGELRRLLEDEVEEAEGRLFLGERDRSMATVWWPVPAR